VSTIYPETFISQTEWVKGEPAWRFDVDLRLGTAPGVSVTVATSLCVRKSITYVSFRVSIKMIVSAFFYDYEATSERQVIGYTL
jgi:hypothetical protein